MILREDVNVKTIIQIRVIKIGKKHFAVAETGASDAPASGYRYSIAERTGVNWDFQPKLFCSMRHGRRTGIWPGRFCGRQNASLCPARRPPRHWMTSSRIARRALRLPIYTRTRFCSFGRDIAMKHKRRWNSFRISGTGCLRADQYGTLELDGSPVVPLLAKQLEGRQLPQAVRLTLTVELLTRPLTTQRGGAR